MVKLKYFSLKNLPVSLSIMVLMIVFGFLVLVQPQRASAEEPIALTVKGDGVEKTVQFTQSELEKMQKTYDYTGYNYYPSLQFYKNTTGVPLKSILDVAGLKDNATMIKIKSPSSTYSYYTKRDLLDLPRYYFPAGETDGDCTDWPPANRTEEGKVPVPTMIAFVNGGKLIFGQQSPLEPTCCKGEQIEGLIPGCTIEVTTEPLEQWDTPDAYPEPGIVTPGTQVILKYGDGSLWHTRVYYTLDGSEPTVKSNILNISYPTFQPALNKPIPITGDVTIKARAIGLGKSDSEVKTYHYSLGALACIVEGAGLSEPVKYAVELLKSMTPTQENYSCVEDGKPVTLAGKGVLLGTLLDQLNASGKWEVKFVTATGEEYAGGTVQELKNQQCMLAYEINGKEVADVSGEQTVKIQILRNLNNDDPTGNRLRYVQTIKLINVDDEITINNVKLMNYSGNPITSVAPGGGYCIEANLVNAVQSAKEALLLIQVRSGEGATATIGGSVVGCTAVQTVVDAAGGKAKAEFTLPSDLSGKAYVDVFVWDNYKSHRPLGKESHELNFDIK
jgi:hypothetical protein